MRHASKAARRKDFLLQLLQQEFLGETEEGARDQRATARSLGSTAGRCRVALGMAFLGDVVCFLQPGLDRAVQVFGPFDAKHVFVASRGHRYDLHEAEVLMAAGEEDADPESVLLDHDRCERRSELECD